MNKEVKEPQEPCFGCICYDKENEDCQFAHCQGYTDKTNVLHDYLGLDKN